MVELQYWYKHDASSQKGILLRNYYVGTSNKVCKIIGNNFGSTNRRTFNYPTLMKFRLGAKLGKTIRDLEKPNSLCLQEIAARK